MMELAEHGDPQLSDTSSINSRRSYILEVNECQVDSATTGSDTGQLPNDCSSDDTEINARPGNEMVQASSLQQPNDFSSDSVARNSTSESDGTDDSVQSSSSFTDAEERRHSFHSSGEPLALQSDGQEQICGGHYGETERIRQLEPLICRSSDNPIDVGLVQHRSQQGTTATSSLEYLTSVSLSGSSHSPRSLERSCGSDSIFIASSESEDTRLASQALSTSLSSGYGDTYNGDAESIKFPHHPNLKQQRKRTKKVLKRLVVLVSCIAVILAIVVIIIPLIAIISATLDVDYNQHELSVGEKPQNFTVQLPSMNPRNSTKNLGL